jgi:glutathione-regulated potassium-efflux system ancillary protein KefG
METMSNAAAQNRVLILFAHPALEKSRVNRQLADAVRDLASVTFHDLYEAYPEFHIDVRYEQQLLTDHEVIVFQHPFYWYSTPPLLKQWEDLVLEHGWAYGSGSTALHGKTMFSAITAGGSEQSYRQSGTNRFTVRELLAPVEQTARLCGMRYLAPFVVHGTHRLGVSDIGAHAEEYRRVIRGLRDGAIDLEAAESLPRINKRLREILSDEKR